MNAGQQPVKATFWLLEAADSLAAQSHREPDGTGLGWFDDHDRPQLRKQPIAAYQDTAFAREAQTVSSRIFIAHIRFASTGALERKNTHPFELGGRLFAHNGVVEGLELLEAHLGTYLAQVKGDTDSERLFALITREIEARGGDVEAGIDAACRWVAANLPLLSINFVLAVPGELWTLRYPDAHELYILERKPGVALEHSSSLGSRISSEQSANRPLVVIASERLDEDPGWRPIAPGELLHVSENLAVSSRLLLEGPPAKPLTLADLGARARASQLKPPPGNG